MTYSPPEYWTERGKTFEDEARSRGEWDVDTPPLMELLRTLEFSTVFEVGCGFGRVGASILREWPTVRYTGLDVSPDLVEGAKRRLPGQELICADLATFVDTQRTWDLVLSVSVLGHLLPQDVESTIARMRKWATKDLITIDWNEVGRQTGFQYGHNYRYIYGDSILSETPIGRITMFHVAP